jgi:hypothetical protein
MNKTTTMLLLLPLCTLPGCFLIEGIADTVTTSAGTDGEIPDGYPTYFVGESRFYSTAPMECAGPDIAISLGKRLDDELLATNDTAKNIFFGDGYDWKGVLHCDPAADASCSTIKHRVSDWADAQGGALFTPQQRDDAMFSDAATLSVFVGHAHSSGENMIWPDAMLQDDGVSSTCKMFWANGIKLNTSSVGPQGANGLVLAAPCYGKASLWGAPVDPGLDTGGTPTSSMVGTQHPNRIYAFGGSALMLAEDALAVWWDTLLSPGQYSWSVAEDWHHWHHALNQLGNTYSNLPVVITFKHVGETDGEFEDRASLSNIRTGYRFEDNPEPKDPSPVIIDWVYYDAPTLCG